MSPFTSALWETLATLRRLVFSGEDGVDQVPDRLLLLRNRENSWKPLTPKFGWVPLISATLSERSYLSVTAEVFQP